VTPHPNSRYTVEGVVGQYQPWQIIRSENPNRITVSIEAPADQANAVLLINVGGEMIASLSADGTFYVKKIASADGILYQRVPAP
jgi:hypothetical protein